VPTSSKAYRPAMRVARALRTLANLSGRQQEPKTLKVVEKVINYVAAPNASAVVGDFFLRVQSHWYAPSGLNLRQYHIDVVHEFVRELKLASMPLPAFFLNAVCPPVSSYALAGHALQEMHYGVAKKQHKDPRPLVVVSDNKRRKTLAKKFARKPPPGAPMEPGPVVMRRPAIGLTPRLSPHELPDEIHWYVCRFLGSLVDFANLAGTCRGEWAMYKYYYKTCFNRVLDVLELDQEQLDSRFTWPDKERSAGSTAETQVPDALEVRVGVQATGTGGDLKRLLPHVPTARMRSLECDVGAFAWALGDKWPVVEKIIVDNVEDRGAIRIDSLLDKVVHLERLVVLDIDRLVLLDDGCGLIKSLVNLEHLGAIHSFAQVEWSPERDESDLDDEVDVDEVSSTYEQWVQEASGTACGGYLLEPAKTWQHKDYGKWPSPIFNMFRTFPRALELGAGWWARGSMGAVVGGQEGGGDVSRAHPPVHHDGGH